MTSREIAGRRVAVTGAAGAIGRQVVALLAAVVPVISIVRRAGTMTPPDPAGTDDATRAAIATAVADYADLPALEAALPGADTLVFIGSDGLADRVLAHHRNILAAARGAGVSRIVLLGSQDADPASPFCYAPVYADTERELATSCAEPVVVRAGLYAEFFGRWVLRAARTGELALPMTNAVAPISRADVARALVSAALAPAPAELTTITGPAAFDPALLAALASRLRGGEVHQRTTSVQEFRHHLVSDGTDPWWSYAFTSLFESIEQGRFAPVTDGYTALTGLGAETFETALRRVHD